MFQTTPIIRILIMILISSITQPFSELVQAAGFGQTCTQRPKSSKSYVKPVKQELQIPAPIQIMDDHSKLLPNSAESPFTLSPFGDDYVTYENSNHFEELVEHAVQTSGSLGQKDDKNELYQSNYILTNGHSSPNPNTRKMIMGSDNQFRIGLFKNKYRNANNRLKIVSASPLFHASGESGQKSGGVEDNDVYRARFNPNFKPRKAVTSSTLLRPLYEETFVDNMAIQGGDAIPQSSTTFTASSSPGEKTITEQISELTTNLTTPMKMTSRSTIPVLISEDSEPVSTFSSTTPFQELTNDARNQSGENAIGTDTQEQTWWTSTTVTKMESQNGTFTGATNAFDASLPSGATESVTPQPSPSPQIMTETFTQIVSGSGDDGSFASVDTSSSRPTSTTSIDQIGESTPGSSTYYTGKDSLARSTGYSPMNQFSTTVTGATELINNDTTEVKTTLPPTSLDDTKFQPESTSVASSTTPESIMGTSQVQSSTSTTPTSSTSPSFISSTLISQTLTSSSSRISNTNTDGENTNATPSMTTSFSNVMSSSTLNTVSESPSSPSFSGTDSNFSQGSETLSSEPTTALTPPTIITDSQTTDKPLIDFSVTSSSPVSSTFAFSTTTSTSYSSPLQSQSDSENSMPEKTTLMDIGTMSMSTSQIPFAAFSTTTTTPTPETLTTISSNEQDDLFCNAEGWLECDESNSTCKCREGMTYDEERSTCVSKVGEECQTGSGGPGERLCIKNASCSTTTIGQVGICQCKDGFLAGKDGVCLSGLGFPCVISNSSSSSSCYPGMKCSSISSGPVCSCGEGWSEGKSGGLRCFLNYNSKCDMADNLCNSFTFLNCSDTGKECKCEDPSNQVYDAESKACVGISSAKCMLKDDPKGRRLNCGKNAECRAKSESKGSSNETGICECIPEHENDWKGNCDPKNGGMSISTQGGMMLFASVIMLKISLV